MTQVQIICSKPGIRRNGLQHSASAIYPPDRWSETELDAFRADPAFIVREIPDGENTQSADDFELRVESEVQRRLDAKIAELQASYDASVREAAQGPVEAAEAKVADLQAALDKATAAATSALEEPAPAEEPSTPKTKPKATNRD